MSKDTVFLDVDPSITERQLKLVKEEESEEFQKFLANEKAAYPSKPVKPFPGFCVKAKSDSGDKLFINVCHCNQIPEPPTDVTTKTAEEVLADDVSDFRIPMSICQIRIERDAKGQECQVCDVAINSAFFKRIENDSGWKNFILSVIFEAIKEKYGVDFMDATKIVLQNKKSLGILQSHKIQDRKLAGELGIRAAPQPNLSEKPKIEMIASSNFEARIPDYRLYRMNDGQSYLIGEFMFSDIMLKEELKLDVGEDRIVIECADKNYLIDIFVPNYLKPETTKATFDKASKILMVKMPLIGG